MNSVDLTMITALIWPLIRKKSAYRCELSLDPGVCDWSGESATGPGKKMGENRNSSQLAEGVGGWAGRNV